MKFKFHYLLAFSAFILSVTAAYFSVTGLGKLFNGAYWSVIIMASGLEFSKLVSLSFLYRYWNNINGVFKSYLLIGIFVLMAITSAGIYGFLSSAYSITSDKLGNINSESEFFEKRKQVILNSNDRIKITIDNKNNRINTLTSLRTNQESRIDTLYKKGMISGVKKTEKIINNANIEIEKLSNQVDEFNKIIQSNLDSISKVEFKIVSVNNNDVKGEISSLKYISIITGKSIDSVVNFFILLLIFVFDPLAIALVIATNKVLMSEKQVKKNIDFKNMFDFLNKNPTKKPSDYINQ
jgi:hypothetical protein